MRGGQSVRGPVVSVDLELLHPVHALEGGETLEGDFGGARDELQEVRPFGLGEGPEGPPEPLDLQGCSRVLVVLRVRFQVLYVDGGQARYEELQLRVREDGDEVPGDDIVETLQESLDLRADTSSHLHLGHQLHVLSFVRVRYWDVRSARLQFSRVSHSELDYFHREVKSIKS